MRLSEGIKRGDLEKLLNLDANTIKYHIRNVVKKLGVAGTEEALVKISLLGLSNFSEQN